MKKYVRKEAIVEAVKWDGKFETIKNNEWLETAIKEDKLILGMNDLYDKDVVLIFLDEIHGGVKICEGDYIIRETYNQKYKIRVMESDRFERLFEAIDAKDKVDESCKIIDFVDRKYNDKHYNGKYYKESLDSSLKDDNSLSVTLKLDTEGFHEKLNEALNEAKEELEKLQNYNIKDKDNFKIITKEMYMLENIGKIVPMRKGYKNNDKINELWEKISEGYNFALVKNGIYGEMYYSVDYINELLEIDKL